MTEVSDNQSPGALLAAARETRGWTHSDISEQINLDEQIVINLENDNYDHLPPPAFVKGYIRSYSKLLEIDSEPLIELYGRREYSDPEINKITSVQAEAISSDPLVRAITVVVVATVLSASLYWWHNNQQIESTEQAVTLSESPSPGLMNGEDSLDLSASDETQTLPGGSDSDYPSDADLFKDSGNKSELDPTADVATTTNKGSAVNPNPLNPGDSQTMVSVETVNFSVAEFANLNSEPAADGILSDSTDLSQTATESAESISSAEVIAETISGQSGSENGTIDLTRNTISGKPVLASSMTATASLKGGENATPGLSVEGVADILLLKAQEESWVSVIDANSNRLMYGLLTSGTPRKLQGIAPFNVVFGFAPGIEVTLNGEQLQFSSHIRKSKTARFIIEPDGSTHK